MMTCHPEFPSRKALLPFYTEYHPRTAFSCQLLQRQLQLYITSPEVMPCPGQPSSSEQASWGYKDTAILAKCGHRTTPTGCICSRTSQQLPVCPVSWCGFSLRPTPLPLPYLPRYWSLPNTFLLKLHLTVCSRRTQPVKLAINAY